MVFSIVILSISLSIDGLFVGFAYGMEGIKIPALSKLIICLFSCFYSGIAVYTGSALSHLMTPFIGRLIGALMLAFIGLLMIFKAFFKSNVNKHKKKQESEDRTIFKLIIKRLGITIQILKNPDAGDIDKSGVIDLRESVLLGSALSFDAVGVGISSALSGLCGFYIPIAVGLCQLLFLSCGLAAGRHLSFLHNKDNRATNLIPGLFLIGLSILRLL